MGALACGLRARPRAVNRKRLQLEKQGIHLIATQQPMASDLRSIVAILSIVVDLERIADRVTNIGERIIDKATGELVESNVSTHLRRLSVELEEHRAAAGARRLDLAAPLVAPETGPQAVGLQEVGQRGGRLAAEGDP